MRYCLRMPKNPVDSELLQAALVGYQSQLASIDEKMAEIATRIGQRAPGKSAAGGAVPSIKPRKMSAAARRRISAAQKKRWAEYNKTQEAPAKKRKLSAAGRKRIAEATKKRWADFRAKKAATLKAAAKPAKKNARRKIAAKKAAAPAGAKTEQAANA